MKVKFSIKEKLYAMEYFEIECGNQEEVEQALDEIGESVNGEELLSQLEKRFGARNIVSQGVNSTDNIDLEDEIEFWEWEK